MLSYPTPTGLPYHFAAPCPTCLRIVEMGPVEHDCIPAFRCVTCYAILPGGRSHICPGTNMAHLYESRDPRPAPKPT